jgi:hypothetical protein
MLSFYCIVSVCLKLGKVTFFYIITFCCNAVTGDGLGEGYGMLGQAGSGKLRVSAAQSKLAAKVAKKYDIFLLYDNLCPFVRWHFYTSINMALNTMRW